jgi:hypothetical protein
MTEGSRQFDAAFKDIHGVCMPQPERQEPEMWLLRQQPELVREKHKEIRVRIDHGIQKMRPP